MPTQPLVWLVTWHRVEANEIALSLLLAAKLLSAFLLMGVDGRHVTINQSINVIIMAMESIWLGSLPRTADGVMGVTEVTWLGVGIGSPRVSQNGHDQIWLRYFHMERVIWPVCVWHGMMTLNRWLLSWLRFHGNHWNQAFTPPGCPHPETNSRNPRTANENWDVLAGCT